MSNTTDDSVGPLCNPPQLYSFKMEEQSFIKGLNNVLRSLLTRPDMTARQVYYTSLMLRALERMPLVTQGLGIKLSLINRFDQNLGCEALTIDEESVRLVTWESLYYPHIGSDTQDLDTLEIGVGWRNVSADLVKMEDWVAELHRRATDPAIEVSFGIRLSMPISGRTIVLSSPLSQSARSVCGTPPICGNSKPRFSSV